jgi:hypothetical protein
VKIEDLNLIGKVRSVYELKKGVTYLVLAEGKNFDYGAVASLFRDLESRGVDLDIHIVGTLHPSSIQIHEKIPNAEIQTKEPGV